MRIPAIVIMVMAAGFVARGGQLQPLIVYMTGDMSIAGQAVHAQALARQMFVAIGIVIEWRRGKPACSDGPDGAISIELVDQAPVESKADTMAYAFPYEGVHIRVFCDRIAAFHPNVRSHVLAHVLVHEIAHVLQGISRHSKSGIMKASWTDDDYRQMRFKSVEFAPEDIVLIHEGMARRAERVSVAIR